MPSRDYIKHSTSTTAPPASKPGDEWFNPNNNALSKYVTNSGNTLAWANVITVATDGSNGTILTTYGNGTTYFSNSISFTKFNETVINGGNTGATTLVPDSSAGTMYRYTLTGNITINALGNAVAGTSMTLILTQDAVGNRLLSSTMKFAGNSKTLSTAASSIDVMSVFFDGTTYYASLAKGFA